MKLFIFIYFQFVISEWFSGDAYVTDYDLLDYREYSKLMYDDRHRMF